MTSQQQASTALGRWPSLRNSALFPEEIEKIERLFRDFFLPPIELDTKFEDALDAVTIEMREPANG